MAVKTDNLSDIENVESLKGLCMSYLEDGMYVCACVLHLMLYVYVYVHPTWWLCVASFPGPARSSLAVRNSRRGPGLVHHVMCAAAYVMAISLRINDVIGWASAAFYVERGSQRSQWRFVRKLS